MLRRMFLLFLLCTISACSRPNVSSLMQEYASRLSRVLATDIPLEHTSAPLVFPSQQTLQRDIPSIDIPLNAFYALQSCSLARHVAERNTTLGKVQYPSQRLAYEYALLPLFKECAATLTSENEQLLNELSQWEQQKQQSFPLLWASVIESSEETRLAIQFPQTSLTALSNDDITAAINSWQFLTQVTADQHYDNLSVRLELSLQRISQTRIPAILWRTQADLASLLGTMNTRIGPLLNTVSCPNGKATEQAKILRNVFYLFFIEQIQPIGSRLNQLHYKLLPVYHTLSTHPALHPEYTKAVSQHATAGFNHYQQTVSEHVHLWQQFLKRCNLSPTAPSANN